MTQRLKKSDAAVLRRHADECDRDAAKAEKEGRDAFQVFAIRNVANNYRRWAEDLENDRPLRPRLDLNKQWAMLRPAADRGSTDGGW